MMLPACLPGFSLAQTFWWRILTLLTAAFSAFGFSRTKITSWVLYVLLQLSLGGLAANSKPVISQLLSAAGICLACYLTGRQNQIIPVRILTQDGNLSIRALRDTGNTLKDPITGQDVLVVDVNIAQKLTGLTPHQLREPVKTMEALPGLRLIPYHSVDGSGFLLAKQFENVFIGTQKGRGIIAFSPQKFADHYEGLTGGKRW